MNRYFNNWSNRDDVEMDFRGERWNWDNKAPVPDFPTDEEILFASYAEFSYEGDSMVLFWRDGRIYQNEASHCSCYGLEGSWNPDEVLPEQLLKQRELYREHGDEACAAYAAVVNRLNGITGTIH